ncbi:MAG: RdgB/HAM1 family non-canonical purine NTP pyrophosphatase [Tatlockia sp.]|nr:RdgB/HAM1 family non-canonical purine NTP pyrophosphatase [Tatlockia sp.]
MKEIILATSNKGKISELQSNLPFLLCIPQGELGIADAEETGLSFVENAIIKARQASRLGAQPALADDSGLVVQALNGAPGIYSARFAGINASDSENINCLLDKLKGIPESQRQAYFFCAIAVLRHADDPSPIIATGKWSGTIIQQRMGFQGFGYDPVFYVQEHQCTAAQLSMKIKNTISHRAQALNQMRSQLENL